MNCTITNGILSVTAETLGAELRSIKMEGREYIWQRDPKYWSDCAPNIFPHVARLTNSSYYMDGQLYNMKLHGFAWRQELVCIENTGDSMTFELKNNDSTWEQYPRAFSFRVKYALEGQTLRYSFTVDNLDERELHFAVGGHPGFNVPICPELDFSDYYLAFEENEAAAEPQGDGTAVKKALLDLNTWQPCGEYDDFKLENGRLKLSHDLFDRDAIILKDMPKKLTIASDKDEHKVIVAFDKMPYVGLWHMPYTDAPYICIEPWSALPARSGIVEHFETQSDFIHLPAGEQYTNEWTITIF